MGKQGVVMTYTFKAYTQDAARLPKSTLTWNLYGAGIDNLDRSAKPEKCKIPSTARNQLLVCIEPKQDPGFFEHLGTNSETRISTNTIDS